MGSLNSDSSLLADPLKHSVNSSMKKVRPLKQNKVTRQNISYNSTGNESVIQHPQTSSQESIEHLLSNSMNIHMNAYNSKT